MTRVLHILNEIRPSGAETMLYLAASCWKEQGCELTALSTGEQCGPFADRLMASGFEIRHLPFRKSLRFFLELVTLMRRFDVVHIHTERGAFEYALAAKVAGVKSIARTIHSYFRFTGRTRYLRILRRNFSRWLGVRHISIGPSVASNEYHRFGNCTTTIPNWFDELRFRTPTDNERNEARSRLNLKHGQWALISVGNCGYAKNHEAILQILPLLPEAIYFHLGAEDQHQAERLLAQQLGVLDRVKFLGAGDPLQLLWGADIYVMPSRYEGFSIAALEAATTGIPCVLADAPGLNDLKEVLPNIIITSTNSDKLKAALEYARAQERVTDTSLFTQRFGVRRGALAYFMLWLS